MNRALRIGLSWGLLIMGGSLVRAEGNLQKGKFPEMAEHIPQFENLMRNPSPTAKSKLFAWMTQYPGKISKGEFMKFAGSCLNDGNVSVRYYALQAILENFYWEVTQQDLPRLLHDSVWGKINFEDAHLEEALKNSLLQGSARAGWGAVMVAVRGDKCLVPELKTLLKDPNAFARYEAARTLLKFGEGEEAANALKALSATYEHFYSVKSMSLLVKRGSPEYLGTMVEFLSQLEEQGFGTDQPNLSGTYDLIQSELEKLTGASHPNASQWMKWWEANKEKWLKERQAVIPAPPTYRDPSKKSGQRKVKSEELLQYQKKPLNWPHYSLFIFNYSLFFNGRRERDSVRLHRLVATVRRTASKTGRSPHHLP